MPIAYGQPKTIAYAADEMTIDATGMSFVSFIATSTYFALPKSKNAVAPRPARRPAPEVGRRGGGGGAGDEAARQPSSVERLTAAEQEETPALGDGEEEATDEYSGDESAAAAELAAEGSHTR